jgi:hypothetical protein
MSKSIPLVACLLCIAALIAAGVTSTQAGTSVPVPASPPTSVSNLGLAVPASMLPAIWLNAVKSWENDGYDRDKDKDKDKYKDKDQDKDKDKDKDKGKDKDKDKDDAPAPTPEPSTLLSFGVALIVGGGVFFLGRLRKARK